MTVDAGRLRAALFDVDGTLTRQPTLFSFRRHWLRANGDDDQTYWSERDELRRLANAGADREQLNRAYFRTWTGAPAEEVAAAGRSWFAAEFASGQLLRAEAVAALHAHQAAGDLVALVSGSFPAVLEPLAAELGVAVIVCTRPSVEDGRMSGEVDAPMIGAQKVRGATRLLAAAGLALSDATAYGDHPSDAALLARAGRAVVIGADDELAAIALRQGWSRMPRGRSAETYSEVFDPASTELPVAMSSERTR